MKGVYRIVNLLNGKLYIGSSVKVKSRFTYHRNRLDKGTHDNTHLQAAWRKYGSQAFAFEIVEPLEDSSIEFLLEREQWHLDNTPCLDRKFGYNITPTANRSILAPESIEKIRQSRLGTKASKETRELLSKIHTGVRRPENSKPLHLNPKARAVNQYKLDGTLIKNWSCLKEAQDVLGVSYSSISGVCAGRHKSDR